MSEWVVSVLLLAGSGLMLIAALGVARLPDLFTRMQAATKAGGPGVSLLVAAVALHFADGYVAIRALLVAAFSLLTFPVAAHLIARAAYVAGVPLWSGTVADELGHRAGSPAAEDLGRRTGGRAGEVGPEEGSQEAAPGPP
jgi:multicomponent Na+:H+ antiporter subunit G